jgi:hypothetical protein
VSCEYFMNIEKKPGSDLLLPALQINKRYRFRNSVLYHNGLEFQAPDNSVARVASLLDSSLGNWKERLES